MHTGRGAALELIGPKRESGEVLRGIVLTVATLAAVVATLIVQAVVDTTAATILALALLALALGVRLLHRPRT